MKVRMQADGNKRDFKNIKKMKAASNVWMQMRAALGNKWEEFMLLVQQHWNSKMMVMDGHAPQEGRGEDLGMKRIALFVKEWLGYLGWTTVCLRAWLSG